MPRQAIDSPTTRPQTDHRKAQMRDYQRNRYRTDAKYRARIQALNAARIQRYANDPEFADSVKKSARRGLQRKALLALVERAFASDREDLVKQASASIRHQLALSMTASV